MHQPGTWPAEHCTQSTSTLCCLFLIKVKTHLVLVIIEKVKQDSGWIQTIHMSLETVQAYKLTDNDQHCNRAKYAVHRALPTYSWWRWQHQDRVWWPNTDNYENKQSCWHWYQWFDCRHVDGLHEWNSLYTKSYLNKYMCVWVSMPENHISWEKQVSSIILNFGTHEHVHWTLVS